MSEADRAKWDARYEREEVPREAPSWLSELDGELPREGRALDVAAGSGRLSLWAARRGLDALAVDVSPVGLARADEAARREGLAIATQARDLADDPRLPPGPFALVTCFHYEQPSLFAPMCDSLAPGGVLVMEIATVRNLERHAHPSRRYLVEPNALLRRAAPALEVVYYREGWLTASPATEPRNLARLIARRS